MLLSAVYSYKNRLKFSVLTLQAAASSMKCNDECSWHGQRVWTSDVTSVLCLIWIKEDMMFWLLLNEFKMIFK